MLIIIGFTGLVVVIGIKLIWVAVAIRLAILKTGLRFVLTAEIFTAQFITETRADCGRGRRCGLYLLIGLGGDYGIERKGCVGGVNIFCRKRGFGLKLEDKDGGSRDGFESWRECGRRLG